jgi:predicted site-specific integrase-resolvase
MSNYIPLRKAVELTGLHPNTLRKYADRGDIPIYRTPNGNRQFDVSAFIRSKECVIGYARVSQPKQKQDLDRQAESIAVKFPNAEIVKDIASGLNFKRKGLNSILERAMQGECITLVITYRDRLARFGFDLIERIITRTGGKIMVLNQVSSSPVEELSRDLCAIITVFSSRLHGLRSNQNKKNIIEAIRSTKTET